MNEALVAVVNADTTVQGLTGRTSRNLVPWSTVEGIALPVVAYQLVVDTPLGDGRIRQMQYQLDAFADGNGAGAVVNGLAEALTQGISVTALAAQGCDAVVESVARRVLTPALSAQDPDNGRAVQRAILDLTLMFFA